MARGKPFRYADLHGGLNTADAPYLLEGGQARDLLNVVSVARGAIRKRNGSRRLTAALPAAAHSLFGVDATATKCLLAGHGSVLSKVAAGGAVTQLQTGLTAGATWEWVQAPVISGSGPVYGMNGVEARYFDGTAVGAWTATAGTLRIGKYLTVAGGRVFIAGVPGFPHSVFTTAVGNPRDLSKGVEVQFDPMDGDAITGIGTVGNYVLVFKRKKVFAIYDTDTGANRRLSDNIGCAAHRTIVETPRGALFLTPDQGVWSTNGDKLEEVSTAVLPTLRAAQAVSGQACAGHLEGRYFLAFSAAGAANDRVLELDMVRGSWWLHDSRVAQFASWRPGAQLELYGAHPADPAVDRLYVPGEVLDAAAQFEAYWRSPWLTFNEPYVRKRCRAMHFDGSGKFDVLIAKDFAPVGNTFATVDFTAGDPLFGGAGAFGGAGQFGGGAAVEEKKVFTPGLARAWSVEFHAKTSAPFEVDSFTLWMDRRSN